MTDEDRPAPSAGIGPESTAGSPAPDAANRRWGDRPGKTPALTLARLLTTSPDLDEIPRCLVGLLAWPIGASGALLIREQGGVARTLARYEEPLDPNLEVLRGQESEPCIFEVISATGGLSPVVWTEPGHPSCRPMAAWPLDTSNGHIDHLVIILGATESAGTVRDRVRGIPEVLAVYLAGRDPGLDSLVADDPAPPDAAVRLSDRQIRVLGLMAQELTMQQIASRIGYSDSTVRMESLSIYRALGVHDRRHAVAAARAIGLLPHDEPPASG